MSGFLLAVLFAHGVVAGVSVVVGAHWPRRALLVGAAAPALLAGWLMVATGRVLDGAVISLDGRWVEELGLGLAFRVDALGLLLGWLIAVVGVLVFWYAFCYFDTDKGRLGPFAATLVLFAGSMVGVVFADDVFTLFLFWEATSVTSFLLIGFNHSDDGARASALQALLVTASGGIAMLGGLVMLSVEAGTSSLSAWLADPPRGPMVPAALVLVVAGAMAKSAQFPLHFWLPGAMAAPTPVSAFLHSATMVNAGVYLIARFAPIFAGVGVWRPLVLTVGSVTMLFGGVVALRRHDLKQILAYGTISQLGFLVVLVGAGVPSLTTAGVAMLLAHGLFKASLFMVVGIVDHSTGTRDVRRLGGLGRSMPALTLVAVASGASMAGLPPVFGFVTKEKALAALLDSGLTGGGVLIGVVALGSILTVAYTVRALWEVFGPADGDMQAVAHHPSGWFMAPAALLAGVGVVLGVAPGIVNPLVLEASRAAEPATGSKGLVLWPGINTALGLSLLIIGSGVAVFAVRGRIESLPHLPARLRGEQLFSASVSTLLRSSGRVTRIAQPGSLPHYLVVVIVTVLALPGVALIVGGVHWPTEAVWADTPLQVIAGVGIVAAAVCAAVLEHRMSAVLALGSVGFGVAVLFVIEGGPDLALTQLLVETVALVAFVLVLRQLPARYPNPPLPARFAMLRQTGRVAVSAAFGLVVFGLAVSATAVRTTEADGAEVVRRALPDGKGSNAVNVILSDFRALDTLGEITVVAAAVIGVLALGTANKQPGRPTDPIDVTDGAGR